MKKRFLASLLTLCLLAGLLPTVALAGGVANDHSGTASTYAELKEILDAAAQEGQRADDLMISPKDPDDPNWPSSFNWPADEEIVLNTTNVATLRACGDWEIPSNVTLNVDAATVLLQSHTPLLSTEICLPRRRIWDLMWLLARMVLIPPHVPFTSARNILGPSRRGLC